MKFRLASGLALLVACTLGLSACSSIRMPHVWPFYKKPKPAPVAVVELNLLNADGSTASYPQYWKRNTLVIDLSGVSGAGTFAARLPEATTWPVRMAVRVRPGSIGQVEIQGEERSVQPVSNEGTSNIDLEVVPSVYTPKTAAIYISWGPIPAFVDTAPVETAPAFVSPTEVPKPASEAAPAQAPAQTSPPGS